MKVDDVTVEVIRGDITDCDTDAIVNAANNHFEMGGGVAAAIKRRGGEEIEKEAKKNGVKEVGDAVLTGAGTLSARHVIHAVTMAMPAGRQTGMFKTDAESIRRATYNALACAHQNNLDAIAFCALGCGTGKFSYEAASKIMAQEVFRYIKETDRSVHSIKRITFVLNQEKTRLLFEKNVITYLNHMQTKMTQGPYLTVDAIIEYRDGIVLIRRSNPPLGWALPGGFVDYGESVQEAVVREVKEETGLDFLHPCQFKVFSDPGRDPRFHTVSVVFTGQGKGDLQAASDAQEARVVKYDAIPDDLAFDHGIIIKEYLDSK